MIKPPSSSRNRLTDLPPEILADIFHRLPADDIAAISSSNMFPPEIVEHAAWLGLRYQRKSVQSSCQERFPQVFDASSESPSSCLLAKDHPETYVGLYQLFFGLQEDALSKVLHIRRDRLAHDVELILEQVVGHAIFWLLFGSPGVIVEMDKESIQASTFEDGMKKKLMIAVSAVCGQPKIAPTLGGALLLVLRSISPERILQTALRLGDAGQGEDATNVLNYHCFFRQSPDHSQNTLTLEAKIFACKFKIDHIYAKTYVTESAEKSRAVLSLVNIGREAVQESLEMIPDGLLSENEDGPPSPTTALNNSMDSPEPHSTKPTATTPAPLQSVFSLPSIRLAAARLALARALESLAQSVGLGATNIAHFEIPPLRVVVNAETDEDFIEHLVAQSFFEEGLHVIQASLRDIGVEEQRKTKDENSLDDLLEMKAATIAARGKLLCCAASTHPEVVIRGCGLENTTTGVVMSMEALLEGSIQSLICVRQKLASSHPHGGLSVAAWCTYTVPRSLLKLQCQTAKDLGKVYEFAAEHNYHQANMEKAKHFLAFALALSLCIWGEHHPSTANIQRMRGTHAGALQQLDVVEIEATVNEWLQALFGNENS